MTEDAHSDGLKKLAQEMTDRGSLIELGFLSFRALVIPHDAPDDQVTAMRIAFFAGAQHLFGAIMQMLDPDNEPTENDLRRMDTIATELNTFIEEFKTKYDFLRRGRPTQ